jgi:hypothetical protein
MLPAHQISAAPVMEAYCRRTSKKDAPAINFKEDQTRPEKSSPLLPAHHHVVAPVVSFLLPALEHNGAPAVRAAIIFPLHPPLDRLFSFEKNKRK